MRPQYTLCLSMSFSDRPLSPFDAWTRQMPRPTTISSLIEMPNRRELPGIDVPGSVRIRPIQNAWNTSSDDREGRCAGPAMPSGAIVRGSAFDQATRMLLLAMVRAVRRNRRSGRTAWLRKLYGGVKTLLFLA
jgi:hypothetical protein